MGQFVIIRRYVDSIRVSRVFVYLMVTEIVTGFFLFVISL